MPIETLLALLGGGATLMAFMLTLAYHLGRLASRVDTLELWRGEIRADIQSILAELRTLNRAVAEPPG